MKTPLPDDKTLIPALLQEYWNLTITQFAFIPEGESAYSYKIQTDTRGTFYLKIVDQDSVNGHMTATQMIFSLPVQRMVALAHLPSVTAPLPQITVRRTLSASHEHLLFALYTFIEGETLGNAYPMPDTLIQHIARAAATVHTVPLRRSLYRLAPQDSLTSPFDRQLLTDLTLVENISLADAPAYLQKVHAIVWPRREQIRAFLAKANGYKNSALQKPVQHVLCHGDLWGGNIILAPDNTLTLLDWESSVIAPRERDAFDYINNFAAFDAGYRLVHQEPIRWHADWLAFYAYRRNLRNLAYWLHNLLHMPLNEIQRAHYIDMLGFHCLERFEGVERTCAELTQMLT